MKPVMLLTRVLAPAIALALASAGLHADDLFAPLRDAMVWEIANMSSITRDDTGRVEFAAPVMAGKRGRIYFHYSKRPLLINGN
ncbi:hypothetical protein [Pseudomonas mandelii]|uniref:hypothetical protein n=1 Tax=Pseudomonas mandelii TaxID=75612 RepID=UPI0020A03D2D|nr:hypothetical protein [Pseudomonas mandelii]MCO8309462.1 hypothetical protein [Pseudomonas mandelii]